ncbi:MAG TPA: GntR family transcriptional regulator [Steroidobacteraceae bacterium]|jgi:DNA-binding GntR family transcriptional regulator|nr:GntR family transcriptional regulator [Steroidobacteraceae bacterium]
MAKKQAKTVTKTRKQAASTNKPIKKAVKRNAEGSDGRGVSVTHIVTFIRERIRAGRYVPGQRLIEADIIRELHATRSRVREALQRLATEGVITIEEFKGASVRHLTRDEVVHLYRTRMVLEALAAAECASHGTPAVKQRLALLQHQLDELEHSGNHEHFAKLNDEWHRLIIEGSQNPYIAAFVERLHVPVYRLLFSTFYNAGRIDSANADHQRITAAIVAGRAKDAEKFMREHISDALDAVSTLGSEFFN